jgi:hypothetical protein
LNDYSICRKNLIAQVSAIYYSHALPKKCLITRNSATFMPGKALGVAATFSRKFCDGLSATHRFMLGMGFKETLRCCGKFLEVYERVSDF